MAWFEADWRSGLFEMNPMDFDRVAREARAISRRLCALLGTRTLDVLHVALAVAPGASPRRMTAKLLRRPRSG